MRTGAIVPPGFRGLVATAGGVVTVLALATIGDGDAFTVEDSDGSANVNPITIDGNGLTIDGQATLSISTAFGCVMLVRDGSELKRCDFTRAFNASAVPDTYTRTADNGGGSAAAPGANTQVVFNDAGALGADAGMTFAKATGLFTVTAAAFGSGTKASAGDWRLPGTFLGKFRGSGGGNLSLLEITASDVLNLGQTSANAEQVAGINLYTSAGGSIFVGNVGTTQLQISTAGVTLYNGGPLTFGHPGLNPASAGDVRRRNGFTDQARNNGNTANLQWANVDAGDALNLWGTAATFGAFVLNCGTGSSHIFQDASNYRLLLSSVGMSCAVPVRGSSGAGFPFRFLSATVTQNAAADITMTSAQYECAVIKIAGVASGVWNLIAPNTADSWFFIDNTNGVFAVTIKKAGGAGFAIAAGKKAWAYHSGADYVRATADV